jgi:CHAT domain-containing protein
MIRQGNATHDGAAFARPPALAEIELLSPGPARSRMAEGLIQWLLGRHSDRDDVAALRPLDRLVLIGDEFAPERPGWRRVRATARSMALMRACSERALIDYRAGLGEVDQLAAEFAGDPQVLAVISAAQVALSLASGPNDVATVRSTLARFSQMAGDLAEVAPMLEMASRYTDVMEAYENGDTTAMLARHAEFLERSETVPGLGLMRGAAAELGPLLDVLGLPAEAGDIAGTDHDRLLDALQRLADQPGRTDGQRAFYLAARGGAAAAREVDAGRIEAIIAELRTAMTLTQDQQERIFHLASLALALFRRSELNGSLGDVREASTLLEQARQLAGSPAHPRWAFANELLALVLRRSGDRPRARQVALEGLRGYAWQVLQQPDPTAARAVARTAAEEATELANWLLVDHAPVDALRALDAGRGLMLFAATELRDPCTRLIEAGRPELAERWRTEEQPPVELRQDVLEVLSRDTGLLDPPALGEIQAALRALEADALIYLVPAASGGSKLGWAVIAPAEGSPRYLPLRHLAIEQDADIERYLRAMTTRDLELLGGDGQDTGRTEFVDSVDALCEWAWKAAMGPVVEPYLQADRIPHLVLIPMGDLARVPWQAARSPDGRYLVEVALSQAASARMLCDTAAAEPVRLTPAGLIVADPDTGDRAAALPSARLEAFAIRESFYPSATYVGRLPKGTVSRSGAGTPDDVRAWLRTDGATAGAMLHLASHGVMETALASASSRLVLAGGDLTADELIGGLGGDTGHPIALAVLAACHTGRSIHGYDEAYSLATMFLAAGVRSVLSTQWSVPDQDTSLLMYMFHHYLVTEHRPPWDALRRAQVWMLDGERAVPDRMPGPVRRVLERSDPKRVVAWAGFVHWGQ